MTSSHPEPVGSHVSLWGEGPLWQRDRLLYVDIEAHKVLSFDPTTGAEKIWDVGQRVGTVVARKGGGMPLPGTMASRFSMKSPARSPPQLIPRRAFQPTASMMASAIPRAGFGRARCTWDPNASRRARFIAWSETIPSAK